jgi:hypothetical protein
MNMIILDSIKTRKSYSYSWVNLTKITDNSLSNNTSFLNLSESFRKRDYIKFLKKVYILKITIFYMDEYRGKVSFSDLKSGDIFIEKEQDEE